jgi:hypothetical protein
MPLYPLSGAGHYHVVPINDLVEHSEDEDCACGPDSIPVKREDGSVGWVISHHALDGRP